MKVYWFTTEVEPMCDKGYLLRHLLKKIEGQESTYSGSEDLWWWGLTMSQDDWYSKDEVTQECLVKGYFQDEDKGLKASARAQVYLSKTKLRLQVGI